MRSNCVNDRILFAICELIEKQQINPALFFPGKGIFSANRE
jgi:hypothetical protein